MGDDGLGDPKIQDFFTHELSAVVGDDGVGDPETENDVLDKIYYLLIANLSQGPCLNPLSELIDRDKQVGQALRCFLEGPQKVWAPHNKRPCNGDRLELLGQSMDLPHEVLASPARPHDVRHVASGRRQ
jgi:hypothetical protein